jgi:nucleotide-binding universal stress UspA family protein
MRLLALVGKQGDSYACYELAKALLQPSSQDRDPVAAYVWFCLAETYGTACEKEIQKLESELSREQILGAQLRAREEFQPLVVLAAAEEAELRRSAEEAERAAANAALQRAEFDRLLREGTGAGQTIHERCEEAKRRIRAAGKRNPDPAP